MTKSVLLQIRRAEVEAYLLAKGATLPARLDTIKNEKQASFSGAALYYKGGGWWLLSGYAHDARDVDELLIALL